MADVTRFRPARKYDLWHDRALFHFLTDSADRAAYVDALCAALQAGGHVVLATFALDGPEKCSGLDVIRYDRERLAELGPDFVILDESTEAHATPSGDEQKFAWFRCRKR